MLLGASYTILGQRMVRSERCLVLTELPFSFLFVTVNAEESLAIRAQACHRGRAELIDQEPVLFCAIHRLWCSERHFEVLPIPSRTPVRVVASVFFFHDSKSV